VCREAGGYQGHLVSPEFGLRRLIEDAMMLVLDPVVTAVHRVHLLLVEAARWAGSQEADLSQELARSQASFSTSLRHEGAAGWSRAGPDGEVTGQLRNSVQPRIPGRPCNL